jgi:hypothetical protein
MKFEMGTHGDTWGTKSPFQKNLYLEIQNIEGNDHKNSSVASENGIEWGISFCEWGI